MENINELRYRSAKERVDCLRAFYSNLFFYLLIIPLLGWLNYKTTSFPWVLFPAIGWGIGLAAHAVRAFGLNPLFGRNWEKRKIREFMDEENH